MAELNMHEVMSWSVPDISDWGMYEVRDTVECLTFLTRVYVR